MLLLLFLLLLKNLLCTQFPTLLQYTNTIYLILISSRVDVKCIYAYFDTKGKTRYRFFTSMFLGFSYWFSLFLLRLVDTVAIVIASSQLDA